MLVVTKKDEKTKGNARCMLGDKNKTVISIESRSPRQP